MATPQEILLAAVENPKRVTVDGETVEAHSLSDIIDATDKVDAQPAATKAHKGLWFSQLVPPGTG